MKNIFLFISLSIFIPITSFAQKNMFSLQAGTAFTMSPDYNDFAKTLGYSYGFDYNRDLFEFGGAIFGVLADVKMTNFFMPSDAYSQGISIQIDNNNRSCNQSYQELSVGLGLSVMSEIGRSGFFCGANVECLGIYHMEPNFDYFTYALIENDFYKITGSIWGDGAFTVGYNLGAKIYKMITDNLGLGLQVDWVEFAPTVTEYVTVNQPYTFESVEAEYKFKYLTTQLKIIHKF